MMIRPRVRRLGPADEPITPGILNFKVTGSFDDLWNYFANQTREAIAAITHETTQIDTNEPENLK